ncbi:MAG: 16S rRNA (guanine(527)-N(7))-methyltransferase RsmG [Alphaproteobacteria bacterium]|nr:16S rRNA (guanine(527)-N(7))-methyltransferase RsmG [Alphaproteobacteria bacterium]MAS47392.1 16S rRNA (guanine(527)-N(7))-methyltransferase RsmG [Alphaproteobacteria bacterium]MAX96735.1 16S rRNA (guanine(527)-N(7))-methyltransferase RsmG [Alphaproteobacteria bacterium]MBN52300.1 16S rRNA (guanine(527)-N(7))-methyltransferase RsmG [Alphaproteobacteria bacterium]OUT41103.1 MAG: 16S rRNA (guanine(527)-N(7))-methyltransferase RsmG [Micavibrio sp. TMED2]|tara:strand:- start:8366 stop:8986 length:621 start_codon:yes stop_codon:yes gene_type:complete
MTSLTSPDLNALKQHPALAAYAALLKKWQPRINLVGPKTLPEMWVRHFQDSAQLLPYLPDGPARLVDFGSGAGFPGLVIACLRPDLDVHLIESDQRKCAFLRSVAQETGAKVTIHTDRIESLDSLKADVVTARALASLDKLLTYTQPHLAESGFCIFLKGQNVDAELTEATKCWNFEVETHASETDRAARVIVLRRLEKQGDQDLI